MENNSELINNLRSGNPDVFDSVYRLYFKGLCSFASQYVSKEEAEEVVQETMLWLWENRQNLIPDMSLKSLLFMIVKNKSLNRITHNRIKSAVHQKIAEKFENQFGDPDFYLYQELTTLLQHAIEKLPQEYRIAFEMNRLQDMTHKEIAQKLNVSHQTVNYRISQALKILRSELKDYLPFLLFILY
ncbi:MAG: RNA polymerase sigma-70 factor [Dysgonamonadaceae bacterium]|jgi:RNA polymerase sigma-70 factor (ECF subfamily)|nr:RNA polymerase sigma-70 factor [Dysgonamonadaceae bacterium]